MIERIESFVRRNAHILSHKDGNPSTHTPVSTYCKKESNNSISYPIGIALIEFMVERGLIDLKVWDVLSVQGGNEPEIKKKKGYRYRSSALYIECKFDKRWDNLFHRRRGSRVGAMGLEPNSSIHDPTFINLKLSQHARNQ